MNPPPRCRTTAGARRPWRTPSRPRRRPRCLRPPARCARHARPARSRWPRRRGSPRPAGGIATPPWRWRRLALRSRRRPRGPGRRAAFATCPRRYPGRGAANRPGGGSALRWVDRRGGGLARGWVHSLLALLDGLEVALALARVDLARTGDLGLRVLNHLEPLGDPARRARDGEHHREHVGEQPERLVDESRVEVDVRVQLALEEVVVVEGALLEL